MCKTLYNNDKFFYVQYVINQATTDMKVKNHNIMQKSYPDLYV